MFHFLSKSALTPNIGDKVHTAFTSCNLESSLHNLCVNQSPKLSYICLCIQKKLEIIHKIIREKDKIKGQGDQYKDHQKIMQL